MNIIRNFTTGRFKPFPLFLLVAFTSSSICAQGDLLVFPKRIVFDGSLQKVKTLHISNIGTDTTTYRISHIEMEMVSDGRLVELDTLEASHNLASKFLRVFPRRVTLSPGESQVVKIQMVNGNSLEKGEYRSHLYFRPVLEPQNPDRDQTGEPVTDQIKIKLNYVYGISIANIIRIGKPEIKVSIDSLELKNLQKDRFTLTMAFRRSGNVSSYGSIVMEYIPLKGSPVLLNTIKGFAIYTPGNLRYATFDINIPEDIHLGQGHIRVTYLEDGSKRIYAQQTLNL
ncbi:hypothetical protein [Flagellimonas halotolerans]|uniref:Molecular chaperone n=1 Tax=Flagellimonas halotolerans TaxID=3112164 RepID=A0ABU6ISS6_9FLAO|nr:MULTISPECIES: hypothetical protein [unclassified Allomuricauda]MEC3966258.1 hypothetical protein [Muricauda sp. SYSU M86414]MEC4266056.1 hypothetical protein [Muricauda sp. SYSU M84420]